jgi:hypothetical protein
MRLSTVRKPRSRRWWGVLFFALLTMNSYVLFDMLDVDGSQMTGWPGDDIIVAEELQVVSDRFLREEPPSPDAAGLLSLSLSQGAATDRRGSPLAPINLRIRHNRMLPRMNLLREMARASTACVDPA